MARYTESQCRLCRRETMKLYLKGDRCYSDKCAIERRNYPPGQHGQGRGKLSDYGLQLREKQKIKRIYGLVEKQFEVISKKPIGRRALPVQIFWFCSNADWTIRSTGSVSPIPAARPGSSSGMIIFW